MRLSTIFVSLAFVLAGTSTALPVERESMPKARFSDSDYFLSKAKVRAHGEGDMLYDHRGTVSTTDYNSLPRRRRSFDQPQQHELTRRRVEDLRPENNQPERVTGFPLDADNQNPTPWNLENRRHILRPPPGIHPPMVWLLPLRGPEIVIPPPQRPSS